MSLTRMRKRANGSTIIELDAQFLFTSAMLVHIERLPGVRVVAKKAWAIADSFDAHFDFRGHRFYIGIPYGCIMITSDTDASPAIFAELAGHIDAYRTVWPTQLVWAWVRYFFLPFSPPDPRQE